MAKNKGKESRLAGSSRETLKFVGLLKNKANKWALFAHKNGEITYSKLGEEPGIGYGKIIKIGERSLTLKKRSQRGESDIKISFITR
ncbi:pilus assembly protein PilP [Legionella tunisiensis]|uniref:pilus assembly protein PilP n=1 Tax=Legionella tunisiensis TaxID=1034944 RepID=UPI0003069422|nr:pilus assembly protein PilP [Legionella tunisiensis]